MTNKKAEHKANENTNKTKDTLQESSGKKTTYTNYASRVTEFRINLSLCHFCHLTETFSKQTLHQFFQSRTGYHNSNRLFRGTTNKEVFLYKIYTEDKTTLFPQECPKSTQALWITNSGL